MEKGDIITVAAGLVIVLVIALIANPHYLAGIKSPMPSATTVPPQITGSPAALTQPAVEPTSLAATVSPSPSPAPRPTDRIYYTDKPFSYPVVMLPERLDMYGLSDIRRPDEEFVTFATLDERRGGLTQVFTVPYPFWAMDILVFDNATPNTGSFRMALCYASNGTVIEGLEMIHPGSSFKKIQTSNTPLYLIVSTTGIDGFRIDFQTTPEYYDRIHPVTSGAVHP